jgi:hypothetical protein
VLKLVEEVREIWQRERVWDWLEGGRSRSKASAHGRVVSTHPESGSENRCSIRW